MAQFRTSGHGIVIDERGLSRLATEEPEGDPNTLYFSDGWRRGTWVLGSLKPTTASATSLIQSPLMMYAIGEGPAVNRRHCHPLG